MSCIKCPHCDFEIVIDPIYNWGVEGKMLRHILEHDIENYIKQLIYEKSLFLSL